MNIDLAERAVREIGDEDPLGRDAGPRLECGFQQVPGGAHRGRFRAAGRGGLYAAGDRGRPSAAGQAGDHVADRADEVEGQVQDRLEPILYSGAAQDLTALGEGDLEQEQHRGKRLSGRAATLARLSQGTVGVGAFQNWYSYVRCFHNGFSRAFRDIYRIR